MGAYLVKRLLLIIPTLFGVLTLTFLIAQLAPGGPVERAMAQITGTDVAAGSRIGGGTGDGIGGPARNAQPGQGADSSGSKYRGSSGLDKDLIAKLERQFGYDQPWYVRYGKMLRDYAVFDFGESFFRNIKVIDLIKEKLPVSISLGLWIMLITYAVSIPLGIRKAVRDGEPFDTWTSGALVIGYAIPGFLFAVLLIVLFAGASFVQWFPLRGLTSSNWEQLSWGAKVVDYLWHIALPVTASVLGSFAVITMLTKNAFLEEIRKQYVLTARAKGLSENRVLYRHVMRNALIPLVTGFPAAFIGAFFTGSLLIETLFSLDGLGLLSYEAVIRRDYPVVLGTLYLFTLIGLVTKLISDLCYLWVDPRVKFDK